MEKSKVIAINITVIAVICVGLIWGETYWRQRTQYYKAEEARGRGDYIAAVEGYDSAIHMYTPGSSLIEKSAERIWKLGEDSESAGDKERALIAYRSLRGSFYAVRGFFTPGREWISRCDEKIAHLVKGTRY
jgi:hypothetical protein